MMTLRKVKPLNQGAETSPDAFSFAKKTRKVYGLFHRKNSKCTALDEVMHPLNGRRLAMWKEMQKEHEGQTAVSLVILEYRSAVVPVGSFMLHKIGTWTRLLQPSKCYLNQATAPEPWDAEPTAH